MTVLKYLQLPFLFDAVLMQQEVAALAGKPWLPHYQVKQYEGEWTAIPLRSKGGKVDDIFITPHKDCVYQDTIFLDRSPYFKKILQNFHCPLQAVRLLKLNAGSYIKEHRDTGLNFENGEIRFHIPVLTHADVAFYLDKERLSLLEGECWYMNFNLLHSIHNKSHVDRVHLVIDALVNDWVEEIFSGTTCSNKKEVEDVSKDFDEETKAKMIIQLREIDSAVSHKLADDLENGV